MPATTVPSVNSRWRPVLLKGSGPRPKLIKEQLLVAMSTDIRLLQSEGVEDCYVSRSPLPYCFRLARNIGYTDCLFIEAEHYAVGMMLFEILLGTKMVLTMPQITLTRFMLDNLRDYLDADTHILLDWLFHPGVEFDLGNYIEKTLAAKPELIADNIWALEEAVRSDGVLWDLDLKSKAAWVERKAELLHKYQLDEEKCEQP